MSSIIIKKMLSSHVKFNKNNTKMKKYLYLLIGILWSISSFAQVELFFHGQLDYKGRYPIDSVVVENITRQWQETIVYPDTSLILQGADAIYEATGSVACVEQNYPNPFNGITNVWLNLVQDGQVYINVCDLQGRCVAGLEQCMQAGAYQLEVILSRRQVYILSVRTPGGTQSVKMINMGNGGENDIHVRSIMPMSVKMRKAESVHEFAKGDCMRMTAYSHWGESALVSSPVEKNVSESEIIDFMFEYEIDTSLTLKIYSTDSTDSLNIEFVLVVGGEFYMGATDEQSDSASADEFPVHRVRVGSFYMSKYEVTQKQIRFILDYIKGGTLARYEESSMFRGDTLPEETILLDRAKVFGSYLGNYYDQNRNFFTGCLPTEAEWEYAARGGNRSKGYKYAGSDSIEDVAWHYGNSDSKSHKVGEKKPNELGLYDMSGNIAEMCTDWYGEYSNDVQIDPVGPQNGSVYVLRGGSWLDESDKCRVSSRQFFSANAKGSQKGFRIVIKGKNW